MQDRLRYRLLPARPCAGALSRAGRGLLALVAVLCAAVAAGTAGARDQTFRRSESNGDGSIDLSDPIHTLRYLFLGSSELECLDAADANDDGVINMSDSVYSLSFLFRGGPPPPPPFESCGPDPTEDSLDCDHSPVCDPLIPRACRQAPPLGDGRFLAPLEFPAGHGPRSATLGDLDGDGTLDIVAANWMYNSLTVLLGAGDGTFGAPADLDLGDPGHGATAVALGDVDGDGALDVVAANWFRENVAVLLGEGDGTFREPTFHPVGRLPDFVALADLDHDGALDIAAVAVGSDEVSIVLGAGEGRFREAVRVPLGEDVFPTTLAIGDLDGDGTLDLAVAELAGKIAILIGAGDGTFTAPVGYPAVRGAEDVAIGDFDADGAPDLAVVGTRSDVSILPGVGDGTFGAAVALGETEEEAGRRVVAGDLDQDGALDIVVTHTVCRRIAVLWGTEDGGFLEPTVLDPGSFPHSLDLGDVDGDGVVDIATAAPVADAVAIFRGQQ